MYGPLVGAAREITDKARVFHWPLEFPDVMSAGGFEVVIGNPPWERIKLQEQEFFAAREPEIALAPTADVRGKLIAALRGAREGSRDQRLYLEFEVAKRIAEASSIFVRECARFPLTGRGDVNTYSLFAELFGNLSSKRGIAGIIVPTGIATDLTTAAFFGDLISGHRLMMLVDFENREGLFPAVDSRMKFCVLTMGLSNTAEFAFFLTRTSQLMESERRFTLDPQEIARINPNTGTSPIFRSRKDADLTARIYDRVPVLVREAGHEKTNPWSFDYMTKMFDMADNSGEFRSSAELQESGFRREGSRLLGPQGQTWVPVYEAKVIHIYDHRWATFESGEFRDVLDVEKGDASFEIEPRYWLPAARVTERLASKNWSRDWLIGWRDITNATNERTVIASAYPAVAVGHTIRNIFVNVEPPLALVFLASLSSLPVDYVARQKLGGTHLTVEILKQLPILPPQAYCASELSFVQQRALELLYTSLSMRPLAAAMGYDGPPFTWETERRQVLKAELDAFYARAYGLTRDELRYILDPADVMGEDYPSETFRVLKNNEMKKFGEYRTRRLVLEAWDRMEAGDLK